MHERIGPCAYGKSLRQPEGLAENLSGMQQVSMGVELGQGSFGTTYRGTWRGGEVAVKSVRISRANEATSFLREVLTLASLRHPNIMPFYGRYPHMQSLAST